MRLQIVPNRAECVLAVKMGKISLDELRMLIRGSGRKFQSIAADAGVHRDTLRNFLQGKTSPARSTLGQLADAVGVARIELIERPTNERPHDYASGDQLPPLPQTFVGRDDYLRLFTKRVQSGSRVVAMFGMPGVGKTALAICLARGLHEQFPDGQVLIDMQGVARSPKDPIAAMREVIAASYPLLKLPDRESQLRALYRTIVNTRRTIIIADDAASIGQIESLLPSERSILIVTSRNRLGLPQQGAGLIDPLSRQSAVQLLLAFAPRAHSQASAISKLCGCLPLALTIAGGALAENPTISPSEFTRRLLRLRSPLRELDRHRPIGMTGIAAAIAISEALLLIEDRLTWRRLGVFNGDFDAAAASAVCHLSRSRATEVLDELVRRNLVEWRTAAQRYRLHDILRAFCRERLALREAKALRRSAAQFFFKTMCNLDADYQAGGPPVRRALTAFGNDRHNFFAALAWIRGNATDAAVVSMLSQIRTEPHCLGLRESAAHRAKWARVLAIIARRVRLHRVHALMSAVHGYAMMDLGHLPEAISILRGCNELSRRTGDGRLRAFALNFLGTAIERSGAPHRAIRYHMSALELASATRSRFERWRALLSLGNANLERGKWADGLAFYSSSLRDACRLRHLRLRASSVGGIANAQFNMGNIARAEERYRQWRRLARQLGDRTGELKAIAGLSLCAFKRNRLNVARRLQHIEIALANELGLPRVEAHGLRSLGDTCMAEGNLHEAERFLVRSLRIARKIADRHSEALSEWKLGQLFEKQGLLASAIRRMRNAVDYEKRIAHRDSASHARYLRTVINKYRKSHHGRRLAAARAVDTRRPKSF